MGKVMFLEDQPEVGFIINVFGKLLSEQEKRELKESENDPVEVRKALQDNPVLEVVTDFSIALKRFESRLNSYDLLIVDRDLFDNGLKYNPANLVKTEPAFSDRYHKREGDFLIGYCKMKNFDIDNRFYIFTGNNDELVNTPELNLMLSDKFISENIIVKGSDGKNKLIELVNGLEDLELVLENKEYLNILRKLPTKKEDFTKLFLALLKSNLNEDSDSIKSNLNSSRNILEAILTGVARKVNTPEKYWNKGSLSCSFFTKDFLKGYNAVEDRTVYNYKTSSVIIESMNLIYRVSSQFGAHTDSGYKPTSNTVKTIINALKDIILWYSEVTNSSLK